MVVGHQQSFGTREKKGLAEGVSGGYWSEWMGVVLRFLIVA